jgi:hypothetical protein
VLLALLLLGRIVAPASAVDEASLRAVLFQRARAESLEVPLVLLCHETRCEMQGNGRRAIDEDWIWYIGDPDSPLCEQVRHPRLLLENGIESFLLKHCRIFRDRDTLRAEQGAWQLAPPQGWPCPNGTSWTEGMGELPPLKRGDAVEIAYIVRNQWPTYRPAEDWQLLPLTHPGVPTFDRSILVPFYIGVAGRVKVIGDSTGLIQHWGEISPLFELHTGNLPPSPMADPTALGAPRLLFTASADWSVVSQTMGVCYGSTIRGLQTAFSAVGDSLAQRYPLTRARLAAALDWIEKNWGRIPSSLTAGSYYPQRARDLLGTACANRLDRALLTAGIAGAAHLRVDVFLARSVTAEPFLPDFPIPQQFDRVLVQVLVAEEDRRLLLDPWEPTLEAAIAPVPPGTLLFDALNPKPAFFEVSDDGSLRSRSLAP